MSFLLLSGPWDLSGLAAVAQRHPARPGRGRLARGAPWALEPPAQPDIVQGPRGPSNLAHTLEDPLWIRGGSVRDCPRVLPGCRGRQRRRLRPRLSVRSPPGAAARWSRKGAAGQTRMGGVEIGWCLGVQSVQRWSGACFHGGSNRRSRRRRAPASDHGAPGAVVDRQG